MPPGVSAISPNLVFSHAPSNLNWKSGEKYMYQRSAIRAWGSLAESRWPICIIPVWPAGPFKTRATEFPGGSAARTVGSLEGPRSLEFRVIAPPRGGTPAPLHCFVVESFGFHHDTLTGVSPVICNGSEQMQLTPRWPQRASAGNAAIERPPKSIETPMAIARTRQVTNNLTSEPFEV